VELVWTTRSFDAPEAVSKIAEPVSGSALISAERTVVNANERVPLRIGSDKTNGDSRSPLPLCRQFNAMGGLLRVDFAFKVLMSNTTEREGERREKEQNPSLLRDLRW